MEFNKKSTFVSRLGQLGSLAAKLHAVAGLNSTFKTPENVLMGDCWPVTEEDESAHIKPGPVNSNLGEDLRELKARDEPEKKKRKPLQPVIIGTSQNPQEEVMEIPVNGSNCMPAAVIRGSPIQGKTKRRRLATTRGLKLLESPVHTKPLSKAQRLKRRLIGLDDAQEKSEKNKKQNTQNNNTCQDVETDRRAIGLPLSGPFKKYFEVLLMKEFSTTNTQPVSHEDVQIPQGWERPTLRMRYKQLKDCFRGPLPLQKARRRRLFKSLLTKNR